MSLVEAKIHVERPPAPFLVRDYLHQTYVRPPLVIAGPGNQAASGRVRDMLTDMFVERNDVDPHLKDVLKDDIFDYPIMRYPDGHADAIIKPQCSQRDVFILQNGYPNPDQRFVETVLMADAAKHAGAESITAILPYFYYSRGDRKTKARQAIAASLMARLLKEAGVTRTITEDIHAEQTTGTTKNPWDNLYASALFIPEIRSSLDPANIVVLAGDVGDFKRATAYTKRLGAAGTALIMKERDLNEQTSHPEMLMFVGDVKDRDVVLVDDETVSFSTVFNGAEASAERGARSITIFLSHLKYALENSEHEKMFERIQALPPQVRAIITTDNIPLPSELLDHPLIKILDSSPLWAEVIWRTAFGVQLSPDLID